MDSSSAAEIPDEPQILYNRSCWHYTTSQSIRALLAYLTQELGNFTADCSKAINKTYSANNPPNSPGFCVRVIHGDPLNPEELWFSVKIWRSGDGFLVECRHEVGDRFETSDQIRSFFQGIGKEQVTRVLF
jgi:hypothetical protein